MLRNRIAAVVAGLALLATGAWLGMAGSRMAGAAFAATDASPYISAMRKAMEAGDPEAMRAACEGFMKSRGGHAAQSHMMGSGTGMMGSPGGMMGSMGET